MNRNLIISTSIVVIIIAVLLGLWWNEQQSKTADSSQPTPTPSPTLSQATSATTPSPTTTPTQAANQQFTIDYSDSGFAPSTLTIPVGSTVTFTNNSSHDMWVASDPHPVHTDFSAFDSRQARQTYSFTFTQAGTYGFHNHLHESDTGTITVE